jgi:hypothetical protein
VTPDEPSQAAGQVISDPSAVSSLLRSQASRTVGRSELAHRHPDLSAVSPEAGVLDENALAGMDPGEGLALLAEMTRSSDQTLRARARLLATRIALRPSGVETPRGLGRPQLGLLTDPYAGADLRGGGTTDIALALRAAFSQASLARAARREVLLLTDGVRTEGADPVPVAGAAASLGVRLHVLALTPPTGEESTGDSTCRALASAGAGRYAPLPSPLAAPSAVSSVLA